ncbi:hypothetical protein [Actinomycetospora flava]|uniref:Uncharacterized protein n=1 Tax=Actinomycetospora flava TaxID=3129232 RepID=A0ABU8M4Z4_9PSEU
MTQIPGEPLGQLMESLDGTRFSHSGIAVRLDGGSGPATGLASALATKLDGEGFDVGGVRWDPFGELWDKHRDLYCIPMSSAMRARALRYLGEFRPEPGEEGTFSLVKLVAVAVALRAVEIAVDEPAHASELFSAASEIASAWAATDEEPSFYCAELVATAYGLTFFRADLVPPGGTTGIGGDLEESWWVRRLAEWLSDRFENIDDPRGRAWASLTSALAGKDWDFVVNAVGASTRSAIFMLRGRVDGPVATPSALREPIVGHPDLARTDIPVPPALVTPRMLWAAFGRETIRRIERP